MHFVGIFFIELILLFFLSQELSKSLSSFFHRVTRSSSFSIYLISIVFLPGTFLHELSHFVFALVLLARPKNFELMPVPHGSSVKMGSVTMNRTDPVRQFIIGAAPFLVGLLVLFYLFNYALTHDVLSNFKLAALLTYLIFVISNTMFSSKKDMEEAGVIFGFLALITGVLYFLGIELHTVLFDFISESGILSLFEIGVYFILIPVVLNVLLIGIFKTLTKKI